MDSGRRAEPAEDLARRFAAAVRGAQLYAPQHPLVHRATAALADCLGALLAEQATCAIGLIGQELIVGDLPIPRAEQYAELVSRLQALGIERVTFERGVTLEELGLLVRTLGAPERARAGDRADVPASDTLAVLESLRHVRVGRIEVGERHPASTADMSAIRRLYADAVAAASRVWDAAQQDGVPDPIEATLLVENIAEAVAQSRSALLALTALKEYDNYTFTHMVNVSILTMAQARGLGIDGPLLREFGLAALMHDIGKVRTPLEILTKPDVLTPPEFAVMRMHVIDGAEMLRRTTDMPALAAVVAFEHHLRLDGTGYPQGVRRESLNLGTMLCSIADVYDAMRSQRTYQESFPSDRIIAVLKRTDGLQFDQHLVRRFSQLMGIYPPGNLVRLDNGETAVVVRAFAPDPYRPAVRVILTAEGFRLPRPYDVNLWEHGTGPALGPTAVVSPLDPLALGIDPLNYL